MSITRLKSIERRLRKQADPAIDYDRLEYFIKSSEFHWGLENDPAGMFREVVFDDDVTSCKFTEEMVHVLIEDYPKGYERELVRRMNKGVKTHRDDGDLTRIFIQGTGGNVREDYSISDFSIFDLLADQQGREFATWKPRTIEAIETDLDEIRTRRPPGERFDVDLRSFTEAGRKLAETIKAKHDLGLR